MTTPNNDSLTYDQMQQLLIEEMKETQSQKEETNPFLTYSLREEAFESFLHSDSSVPCCGCGNPESTWQAILDALNYCAIEDWDEQKAFLKEKFGVEYVTNNGLVQFLFYSLDDKGFLEHGGSIGGSWLTDAGKIFRVLLQRHLSETPIDDIADWKFDIDFDAILAG